MMVEPKRKNVREINMPYIQQKALQEQNDKRRKRGMIRRIMALVIVFSFFASLCLISIYNQYATLEEKRAIKEELSEELEMLVQRESELRHDIEALNDLDYIAEIARRDYYLTKEGEILFKLPEKSSR